MARIKSSSEYKKHIERLGQKFHAEVDKVDLVDGSKTGRIFLFVRNDSAKGSIECSTNLSLEAQLPIFYDAIRVIENEIKKRKY